jgi:WD repeat-containing protein 26
MGSKHENDEMIVAIANGALDERPRPELTSAGLNKNELVRLLVQTMDSLGYERAARLLEQESGTVALSPHMRKLRECVLSGRWDEVEAVFDGISCMFRSEADAGAARFVVYEQQFLELLDGGKTSEALQCLRTNLARWCPETRLLHKLPLLCICSSPEEVRQRADWAGTGMESRIGVLQKLQKYLPPSELLQENRLEVLLDQAVQAQMREARYPYTVQDRVSLFEDLEHCPTRVPRKALFRLDGHADEVWSVAFSHNGQFLASASKDKSLIIWDWAGLQSGRVTESNAIRFRLKGHTCVISLVSWSPDDKHLLSCGKDNSVRLWSIDTGTCVRVFEKHLNQVTACAWMPDGQWFVSAGMDKAIYEWNAWTGECVGAYKASNAVFDMSMTGDGTRLVVICTDNVIQVFDTATKTEVTRMKEKVSITSMCVSVDGEYVLVNTSANDVIGPEIHIWDVGKCEICQTLRDFKQQRFVIRGCFGGRDEMVVMCGSEDGLVYMWHRGSGEVLARLEGHTSTVNAVACNASDPDVFASGSDDKTIIVWGTG